MVCNKILLHKYTLKTNSARPHAGDELIQRLFDKRADEDGAAVHAGETEELNLLRASENTNTRAEHANGHDKTQTRRN